MSSLLVLAFIDEDGAGRMITELQSLQKQNFISIKDAAIVIRKPDGKIKIQQANSLVGKGALGGAFWGMLIGLLFFMPWLGMAVGAVTGALAGKLTDYGIEDSFIKEVGAVIRPGHSALFLLVEQFAEDKVIAALARHKATLLRTNLTMEDEVKLREAFGAAEMEL